MNKTVVITGASQGLGLALAKEGINRGYTVFALDINISNELNELNGCHTYICDVTSYESVQNAKKFISEHTDSVDILFNNAGVWLDSKRVPLDNSDFDFDIIFRQFDVNAVGVIRMPREFLPMVEKSEIKFVINLSSEAGSITDCWRKCEYGYCMSKAAQNMATKIMCNAYPNIKFHSVHPGWMITPQGMAGAEENNRPNQNPNDTAVKLYDMAEKKNIQHLYCNFEGNKLNACINPIYPKNR